MHSDCFFRHYHSFSLSLLGTDDEQFNDEKAYLIKQISDLKDTKAWNITFVLLLLFCVCVMCVNSSFFFLFFPVLLIINTYTQIFFLCLSFWRACLVRSFFNPYKDIVNDRPCKTLIVIVFFGFSLSLLLFFFSLSFIDDLRVRVRERKFCAMLLLCFICFHSIHCCPLCRHLQSPVLNWLYLAVLHLCLIDISLFFLFFSLPPSFNMTDKDIDAYCA